MTRNVRVALVGIGAWGERQLGACERVGGLDVVALCDQRPGRLAELGHGRPTFTCAASLFAAGTAEAVVIATPNASHARMAADALQAGLHVLVEKPLALSLRDAEWVAALARRHRRVAMVGQQLEHHPRVLALQELLATGQLGRLKRLESRRLATRITRDDPWWTLAPHDVSVALRLLGSPSAIRFVGDRGGSEIFELTHSSGATTRIEVGFGRAAKVRELRLVGSHAAAVFDDTVRPSPPSPLERQAAAFVAAIRGDVVERGGVDHGVEVVRWLELGARLRDRARRGAA